MQYIQIKCYRLDDIERYSVVNTKTNSFYGKDLTFEQALKLERQVLNAIQHKGI